MRYIHFDRNGAYNGSTHESEGLSLGTAIVVIVTGAVMLWGLFKIYEILSTWF